MKRHLLTFCSFLFLTSGVFAQSNLSYSINVPGNRSFILLANPLDRGGNTLNNVLTGVPDGCLLFKFDNTNATWQGAAYNAALNSWIPGGIRLRPGEGAFLQSPTNFTLVFQGIPHVPVLPVTIPDGAVYLLSSQSNGIGTYETIVGVPPPDLAAVYKWTGSNYSAFYADSYSASGWDDALFMDTSPPTAAIGEAIWVSPSAWEPYDPPQLDCPASKTVGCTWSFDLPNVLGSCGGTNVVITVLNTITNGGGCQKAITRTWQILDLCSNVLTCSQTVRVVDSEPPVLTCASNKTVECGSCFLGTNPPNFAVVKAFSTFGADGQNPFTGLIQGNDGWLYGVTENGGSNGVGTIFKIATDGSSYAILHHFQSFGGDGFTPKASLLEAADGMLYGTTLNGGNFGQGTAFKLNTNGASYEILKSFTGSDGWSPQAALIQGTNGALYGTTVNGGNSGVGTVFTMNTDGTGFAVLKSFTGGNDGGNPESALFAGSDGLLYGTTYAGGAAGVGTVFQLNGDGSSYQVIYSFSSGGGDARNPSAALMEASDGMLYGTTRSGGNSGIGAVFKIARDGSGYAVLRSFTGSDGNEPWGGLVEICGGDLAGTTRFGGTNGTGTVFKLSKDGTNYAQIYSFANTSQDGQNPCGGVLAARDGALYGTAAYGGSNGVGTIFSLSGNSPWEFDPPFAFDACCGTNVTVTVLSTATNGAACSQAITRFWQATDCCSNNATCSQTVIVRDSRAPLFLDSPTNVATTAGNDLTLSPLLTGATPLSLWLLHTNGSLRAVSTSNSLFLPALLPSDSGQYFLLASNVFGTATSSSFNIQAGAPTNLLVLVDADNALKIIGTDGDDDIEVRLSGSDPNLVEVADLKNPPAAWNFPTNGLTAFFVDLAAGQDRVTFNATNGSLVALPEPEVVEDNTEAYGKAEGFGDPSPPWWTMTCPSAITVECLPYYANGTDVPFSAPSATYNNFGGEHSADRVTCDYPGYYAGHAYFPVGTTTVSFTAEWTSRDGKGSKHTHTCSFQVTVHDTTPPYLCKPFTSAFSTNFNAGSPAGMTRYGNAIVQNGVLKLTRNIASQFGAAVLKNFHPHLIGAFDATFKLYIGGGTSPGGEGFSFNLAADLPATPTAANANEEGMGTGLTISFDTRNSGPGDAIGIELKNGGGLVRRVSTQVSQGPLGTTFKDVSISLGFDGIVKVTYDGNQVINEASGYVPVPGSRFALAARTQSATDNHWVDDLRIEAKSPRQDVVVNADTGSCGRTIAPQDVFTALQPSFCDTCDSHLTIAYSPPLPHVFPTGTNKLCFAVSDPSGNPSVPYCIDVVVLDKTAPVLSCAGLPVVTSNGCIATVPDFRGYVAPTDNCTPNNQILVTQDPAPGSILEQGTYSITITACDAAGNCSPPCTAPAKFVVTGSVLAISGLHNTGLDANDQPLAGGSADTHFTAVGFTPKVVTQPTPWDATLPDTTASQWIGTNASGAGTAGSYSYTYRLTFSLPCFESVHIHGRWASDNSALIRLNGVSTMQTTPLAGYLVWTSFDLTSGFQTGLNTLDFVVNDSGGFADSTGLRVEFTDGTYVSRCCAGNTRPPSGLVLWIPFDETDTRGTARNLVHAINGTYFGANGLPGVNNDYVDRSLCFNGNDQGVRVAYYPEIDIGTQDFTIDAWVRRSAGDTGLRQIVDHRVAGHGYALYLNNGALTCFMSDTVSTVTGVGPTVPADNAWHFVALVVFRNSANNTPPHTVTLWVDNQTASFSAVPIDGIPLTNLKGLTTGAKNDPPSPPAEVFNGCIDEVEIFNRALTAAEIGTIFGAAGNGKFKFTCQLPSIGFCPGDTTVSATATICNRSSETVTFFYGLRGLLPGCGNLSGPLTIGNSPNSVSIEPWQCKNVTFSVPRPAGLSSGKSGCVLLEVYPQGKDGVIQAQSTVYPVQTIYCSYPVSWPNGALSFQNSPHGSFTAGPFGLPNPYDTNYVLNYRIRVSAPDGTDDQRVISLEGLPPGTPVTNAVLLAPGAYTMVTVNGQFVVDDPERTYHIWLEADMDGDGTLDPLYILPVTEYYPAQLELRPSGVDLNGDTVPDAIWPSVSWFGDGVLQTTPALNQPWTDIPSAPNPYPFNPTNSARFFRLRR